MYFHRVQFTAENILPFLQASMPLRFQDVSPYAFEDFIGAMFRADGYQVEGTNYSGDFGADLLVEKEKNVTAVQVKRYGIKTSVGVADLNQVIGAREYYKTDNAMVITTSDFTQPAIELAKSADVFLWNWPRLETQVNDVFFEGKSFHAFFGNPKISEIDQAELFVLHVENVIDETSDESGRPCILAHLGIENASGRNLNAYLDLPIVVSRDGRQIQSSGWVDDYYTAGLIMNGATVEVACRFLKSQLDEIRKQDEVIIRLYTPEISDGLLLSHIINGKSRGCLFNAIVYVFLLFLVIIGTTLF